MFFHSMLNTTTISFEMRCTIINLLLYRNCFIKINISTSDICAMYHHPCEEIVPWIRIQLSCNRVQVLEMETILLGYPVRGSGTR